MRVLLDTCAWGGAREVVAAAAHDVVWSGEWESRPGDEEIPARAYQEGRVLVTLDKDFGELAVLRKRPHAGIVRLVGIRARDRGPIVVRILASHGLELAERALVTAEPGRLRIRPATRST